LKFKKWNEIAELIGIGAVVVSLLLLMIELRGNTEALQAQTINAVYQAESQRRLLLITNEGGIVDLIAKARNEEVLTEVEIFRLRRYYTYILDTFEYQFGEVRNGRLPLDILNVSNWRAMWGQSGLVSAFEGSKLNRDPAFVEYWDEHVVNRRRQRQ
jgi:hypothetical protein